MANAIRALAMDAVQKAKSGHPGMPMGMADIATALWTRHLRFNPQDPKWSGRDRFILSNGHGSMLQYALLHLTGFDLSMDDLKAFRQLGSRTPGHPEVDITPGWKRRPARSDKVSPTVSAWRSQRNCWPLNSIEMASRSSTIVRMCFWATAA